jgi:hypothetical protein
MGLEVAAIIGIASLATGVASTGMSIGQAAKQKKLKEKADLKATQAIADAKKEIDVNYMDQLSIPKGPYRLAREAALSSGAQALEAGREGSSRGAAATAGRVVAGQNKAQQQIASTMSQDIARLDQLSAQEDSNIATKLATLDLKTAEGAQLASRDAQQARNAAIAQAIKSGGDAVTGAVKTFAPLFPGTGETPITTGSNSPIDPNQLGGGGFAIPNGSNKINPFALPALPAITSYPYLDMFGNPVTQ